MASDPITVGALGAQLKTESTGCGHAPPRSRLISEAYAQTS